MQNKGLIGILACAFVIVCLYEMSFTFVARHHEKQARNAAIEYVNGSEGQAELNQAFDSLSAAGMSAAEQLTFRAMDSLSILNREEANYLSATDNDKSRYFGWTFKKCRQHEINLGLDLKGGMNVMLEVSTVDVVKSLAGNTTDTTFNKAIEMALERQKNSVNKDFVTLFNEAIMELNPDEHLARFFGSQLNVSLDTENSKIIDKLKEATKDAYDNTYETLSRRIDRLGVAQPSIQKLPASERIMVELPGVKDPQRVRNLLKGTAQLEFWATYSVKYNKDNTVDQKTYEEYNSVMNMLLATDDYLAKQKVDTKTVEASEATADEADAENADAAEVAEKAEGEESEEAEEEDEEVAESEATDGNGGPLMALLKPAQFVPPMVFAADGTDTAKINRYLAQGYAAGKINARTVKFLWSAKPESDKNNIYLLYAIKVEDYDRDGKPMAKLGGGKEKVIEDARRDASTTGGGYEVSMEMTPDAARIWRDVTAANVNKCVAVVLDDQVYSAPNVNQEISGGRSEITGNFTPEEANDLANVLKSGKLPAPARIVQEDVVGPSLGQESIHRGLLSFVLAFIVVLLYMVVFYNRAGWVSVVALITNVFLLVGVLASIGAVLTLPGIAGIVLTMAMAVDGNVIIYERVKEGLREGKNLTNAIEDGFKNAYSAIIDGQVTTFLLGLVLIMFGSGTIKGFAVTLCIGIITSLFTSIFITHLLIDFLMNHSKRKVNFSFKFSENFLRNVHINFMDARKKWYIIGGAAILICLLGIGIRHLSLGIDFTGGRTYVVRFNQPVNVVDVRADLAAVFADAPEVKSYGPSNQVKITTNIDPENYYDAYRAENGLTAQDTVTDEMVVNALLYKGTKNSFLKLDDGSELTLEQFSSADKSAYGIIQSAQVEATMAKDMSTKAIFAVLGGLLVIFCYIGVRFRSWRFGLGSIAALAHDTILVIGVFALLRGLLPFNLDVDQQFIAAILTVIGYSINATVVIFDRVRENIKLYPKRDLKMQMNDAINATLARTVNTTGTTFFTLLMMFIVGGEVIRGFVFALLVGVLVGVFSSIFLACPIVYEVSRRREAKRMAKIQSNNK
ncbi:MAG: protein translocase subunit SecDF [Bacteroidales bacterium]|nr:protein translocase subunit SecDF [Bacteroidales bacterium]